MTTISTGSKRSNIQDKNSTEDKSCELDENLVKALLVKNQPSSTPRFSQDAISGISKLLHSFIVEARRRALVEVRMYISLSEGIALIAIIVILKMNLQRLFLFKS